MKSIINKFLIVTFICSIGTSCSSTLMTTRQSTSTKNGSTKNLPPGQAKKLTGDQSAKKHAPGQKKK